MVNRQRPKRNPVKKKEEKKKKEEGRTKEGRRKVTSTLKEDQGKRFGMEVGLGFMAGGVHQGFLASSLNAPSLSLLGMISWSDPTWRKHSII